VISHNVAWHCEAPSGDNLIEYFEIKLKECLMRLRWGRILRRLAGIEPTALKQS
jgi:hypothetical protein